MLSAKKSIFVMTAYLVIYIILINTGLLFILVPYLYIVSPFFIVWMVACILKDTRVKYPELKENEEWGYADKTKDELGFF
ncbi:hypothetical protein [Mucilaginibacter gotjawali]|nr:hypothetical protein [Mucilaginibacter gotjawali]MBB3053954.1 fatty acid desaturase [Mucilaginibacter gotjawali]